MLRAYLAARDDQHRRGEIDADGRVARGAQIKQQVAGAARDFEDARALEARNGSACPRAPAPARDERADPIVRECELIVEESECETQEQEQ